MGKIALVLLIIMSINPVFADQGLIAKKPYHDEIYVCKKRTLYLAVDKSQLTTLESVLTKSWRDRVNPKILSRLDSEFIMDKMSEYDKRISEIKRHFDIKFVDWYEQNITFKPAFRVGRGGWEKLPQGDYESHRWLQFWEWFIREWNLLDNYNNWDTIKWKVREKIFQERTADRKKFIERLIKDNPDRYEYTEYDCYEYDETGYCGYYSVFDKVKNDGVQIYELGYIDKAMPTIPPEPKSTECPLDPDFKINFDNK